MPRARPLIAAALLLVVPSTAWPCDLCLGTGWAWVAPRLNFRGSWACWACNGSGRQAAPLPHRSPRNR